MAAAVRRRSRYPPISPARRKRSPRPRARRSARSALVFPGGRGEEALRRIVEERDELLLSKPILDELLGVLARKFAREAEELARVAVFLGELATMVKPARRLKRLEDDADNRILECARALRDYLA